MRWLGALLVLAGAGGGCLLRRQGRLTPLRLGQALLVDLGVLSSRVCGMRRPLPDLLARDLTAGPGALWLWQPLLALLREEGMPLSDCWICACGALPSPLGELLAPLGPLLPAGGGALERAVEDVREELAGFLREERARQAVEGRLTAALCLSGACLLILVLI